MQQTPFQGAPPRVVGKKPKFRVDEQENIPQNIMFDRRVFRGSTNAAMVIPQGSYPDKLFKSQPRDPKYLEQKRAQTAENFFAREVKTPDAQPGRQNIDI